MDRLERLASRIPVRFLPPVNPPAAGREVFLHVPAWHGAAWVEVLVAFLAAFAPGDPVALVLPLGPGEEARLELEEAQRRVLTVAEQAGHTEFPDLILVDQVDELSGILGAFARVHILSSGRTSECQGPWGQRFNRARQLFARGSNA